MEGELSSLGNGALLPSISESKCSNDDEPSLTANETQETIIEKCLNQLLDHQGEFISQTATTRQMLDRAIAKLDQANALFIEVLRDHEFDRNIFSRLSEAENLGCNHPILYYFMGKYLLRGCYIADWDPSETFEYLDKALAAGCDWAHLQISYVYYRCHAIKDGRLKGGRYIGEFVMTGGLYGIPLSLIEDYYVSGSDYLKYTPPRNARNYYHHTLYPGYTPAYLAKADLLWQGSRNTAADKDKAVLTLLEAEKKAMGEVDNVIIENIVSRLIYTDHVYKPEVLGRFKNRGEMALHYCDVSIQRGSPKGYYEKGNLYICGRAGLPRDVDKAVSIWEEADRVGLADFNIYHYGLLRHYLSVNGQKVLEYGEKAVKIASSDSALADFTDAMAAVYKRGIPPIELDGRKALQCYSRALTMLPPAEVEDYLYSKMAAIFKEGVPPIAKNEDLARQVRGGFYYEGMGKDRGDDDDDDDDDD